MAAAAASGAVQLRRRAGSESDVVALSPCLGEDPLSELGRGRRPGGAVREAGGGLSQSGQLLTAALADSEVLLEAARLLVVERVKRVRGRERMVVCRHLEIVRRDVQGSERVPNSERQAQ